MHQALRLALLVIGSAVVREDASPSGHAPAGLPKAPGVPRRATDPQGGPRSWHRKIAEELLGGHGCAQNSVPRTADGLSRRGPERTRAVDDYCHQGVVQWCSTMSASPGARRSCSISSWRTSRALLRALPKRAAPWCGASAALRSRCRSRGASFRELAARQSAFVGSLTELQSAGSGKLRVQLHSRAPIDPGQVSMSSAPVET